MKIYIIPLHLHLENMTLQNFALPFLLLLVPCNPQKYLPTTNPFVYDFDKNPLLTPPDAFEWILGDPTLFTTCDDKRVMFANEVFHGIIAFVETASSSNVWERADKVSLC